MPLQQQIWTDLHYYRKIRKYEATVVEMTNGKLIWKLESKGFPKM